MRLASQPKGLFHLIAIQMWEFFSYYGMRSLLILFLTQKLLMTDHHAYALYGAYTSLVYVTPIIGGYLADRYFGNYWSVVIGALLMVAGHAVLSIPSVGNISAAMKWGWHVGFALAGIGMLVGLIIFSTGRRNFTHVKKCNKDALIQKSAGVPHWLIIIVLLALTAFGLVFVLKDLLAGYILAVICAVSFYQIVALYRRSSPSDRSKLNSILYFMIFGTVFWAFDQQGGSSISLFIERNINTDIFGFHIPTAFFQSVNPVAVIVGGGAVAWLWKVLASKSISVRTLTKLNMGLLLLTAGFTLITISSKLAMNTGHTTFLWLFIGLFLIGVAELFIDPVALAAITRLIYGKQHTS